MIDADRRRHEDAAPLQGPVGPRLAPPRREAGVVVYELVAARTHGDGDPLTYSSGVEYRDRAELASIAKQLPGSKFLNLHPDPNDREGYVRDGAGANQVIGRVRSARVDGDYVVATVEVTDDRPIRDGAHEVSLGYDSALDVTRHQRRITVDHLAVVERGRCGPACRLRVDHSHDHRKTDDSAAQPAGCGSCNVSAPCYTCKGQAQAAAADPVNQENHQMPDPTIHTDEAVRSLASQLASVQAERDKLAATAEAEKSRADQAEGKLIEAEKDKSKLASQVAVAQQAADTDAVREQTRRADAAEAKVAEFDRVLENKVRERVALERAASVILPSLRMDKLDDRAIMAAVVKHADAEADVSDGVPTGIIQGRFLAITAARADGARAQARVGEILASTQRADAAAERKTKKADEWKKPLPSAALKRGN